MAASAVGGADPATLEELFASARELVGDVVRRHDEQLLGALAGALEGARQARGAVGEPTSEALAEHLYAASYGFKHQGHVGEAYLARMRVAIHIVCKSEGLIDKRRS